MAPNFSVRSKDMDKLSDGLLQLHLTGVMEAYSAFFGYFDMLQWGKGANLNASVLLRFLLHHADRCGKDRVFYVQLDSAGDNKNYVMMGFFYLLVEYGIFRKVKVSMLPVGHTHEVKDYALLCT